MKNPTKISLHHRYTRAISSLQHGETLKNVPEKRANMFSRDFSFLPLFFLFILVYFCLLLNGPRSSYIFLFYFWGVLEAPLTARVRVCILRNSKIYRTRTENNTRKFFFTSVSLSLSLFAFLHTQAKHFTESPWNISQCFGGKLF